jgi:hypothetical protein
LVGHPTGRSAPCARGSAFVVFDFVVVVVGLLEHAHGPLVAQREVGPQDLRVRAAAQRLVGRQQQRARFLAVLVAVEPVQLASERERERGVALGPASTLRASSSQARTILGLLR